MRNPVQGAALLKNATALHCTKIQTAAPYTALTDIAAVASGIYGYKKRSFVTKS
jgi:hypothetical protein